MCILGRRYVFSGPRGEIGSLQASEERPLLEEREADGTSGNDRGDVGAERGAVGAELLGEGNILAFINTKKIVGSR
jgi:hypothetical protein